MNRTIIAIDATNFLEYLSEPASPESENWQPSDRKGLDAWSELEGYISRCETSSQNEPQWLRLEQFYDLSDALHTALPYSEAERLWLVPQANDVLGQGDGVEQISQLEDQIVSAGLRQTVRGRELMRRWISWHRETDEYAGQNTLGVARSALAGLIGLLEPRQPLPEAYVTLMRERDAAPPEA